MIEPKSTWQRFRDNDEKLRFMKKHRLIANSARFPKTVVYSGYYVDKPTLCEIVGHDRDYSCVLEINGQLHSIAPDCLVEMQSGKAAAALPEEYIVLDFETTGYDPKQNEVIEIAALKFNHGKIAGSYETLVNPGFSLPPFIEELTGITQEELNAAPPLDACVKEFYDFLGETPIVAHNASFERRFLEEMFYRYDLDFYSPMIDSIALAKKAYPGLLSYSLEVLKVTLDLPRAQSHRAMADVENTAALIQKCAQVLAEGNVIQPEKTPSEVIKEKNTMPAIDICPDNALHGKILVFTGELSFSRDAAVNMATQAGAVVKGTVSGKTDYLVVGQQDPRIVGLDGMSTKEEQARHMLEEGKAHLQIIKEDAFLKLLTSPCPVLPNPSTNATEKTEYFITDKEQIAYEHLQAALSSSLAADGLDPSSLKVEPLKDRCSVYFGTDTNLFCHLRFRGKKHYVEIPILFKEEASNYGNVQTPVHKDTGTFDSKDMCKLICHGPEDLVTFKPLLLRILNRVIEDLPTDFGCCSRYIECSDAKRCVNPDKQLALQCFYLKNLRKGNIFYGKNKIDKPVFF